jgi:hypothetical protein
MADALARGRTTELALTVHACFSAAFAQNCLFAKDLGTALAQRLR